MYYGSTDSTLYCNNCFVESNCRFAYIPANVGEDKKGQKRSKTAIDEAVDESIDAESKKGTTADKRKKTAWTGADKRITKGRPKSVLDKRKKSTKKKAVKKKTPSKKKKATTKKTTKQAATKKVVEQRKAPEGITHTGEQTEFTHKVWDEIEKNGGVNSVEDAKRVGQLVREEAERRHQPKVDKWRQDLERAQNQLKKLRAKQKKLLESGASPEELQRIASQISNKEFDVRILSKGPPKIPEKTYLEVMSEVRDFGGETHNFQGGSSQAKRALKKAEKRYPKDWVEKSAHQTEGDIPRGSKRPLYIEDTNRGYYSQNRGEVSVGRGDPDSTATHELGHSMEQHAAPDSKIAKLEHEFVEGRAAEGEVPTQIFPDHPDPEVQKEVGIKDEFKEHYMGKTYEHQGDPYAAEVLTMGYEGLMHDKYGVAEDTDMTDFVLGMVVGI